MGRESAETKLREMDSSARKERADIRRVLTKRGTSINNRGSSKRDDLDMGPSLALKPLLVTRVSCISLHSPDKKQHSNTAF